MEASGRGAESAGVHSPWQEKSEAKQKSAKRDPVTSRSEEEGRRVCSSAWSQYWRSMVLLWRELHEGSGLGVVGPVGAGAIHHDRLWSGLVACQFDCNSAFLRYLHDCA